jgi:hypothetical protein
MTENVILINIERERKRDRAYQIPKTAIGIMKSMT